VLIGVVKASLVGLFFMRLLHSSRMPWLAVLARLFWLAILMELTLSDYLTHPMLAYRAAAIRADARRNRTASPTISAAWIYEPRPLPYLFLFPVFSILCFVFGIGVLCCTGLRLLAPGQTCDTIGGSSDWP
jgi:hypothetical protein